MNFASRLKLGAIQPVMFARLISGAIFSIFGMGLRWLSHLSERKDKG